MGFDLALQFDAPVTNCYPPDYSQLLNDLQSKGVAVFPDTLSGFSVRQTEPPITDRDKIWVRTDVNGYILHIYRYTNGVWASPNPVPAGSPVRVLWTGIESDVWSYDGGDGSNPATTIPTIVSGAMWEVDHAFDCRMPLGAGTFPTTSLLITPGATGGEQNHTLTLPEMPAHTHTFKLYGGDGTNNSTDRINTTDETLVKNPAFAPESQGGDASGATVPHNNLPPYVGIFFIKRTARTQYTV